MAAFKRHVWDGYIRLLTDNGTFPAGLAWLVEEHLKTVQNVDVRWVWEVEKPPLKVRHTNDIALNNIELYPWQKKAVRIALERGRGILKMATGAGKSETISGIIRCLEGERPPKTLVVVPNRNLLNQTADRLEDRLGFRVGRIGYGTWNEDFVTVAIPDTLSASKFSRERRDLFKVTELLLLDECHHAASQKWSTLINKCPAFYRFGFSGTPLDRGDGSDLKLEGATGPLLVDISSALLVKQGRLAKPTVTMLDVRKPTLPHDLDWEDIYSLGIVRNIAFHQKVANIVQKEANNGKQVLVLVTRIAHGEAIQAALSALKGRPHEAPFVHGKTFPGELKTMIDLFKSEKLKVLIASPIFGEGTDLPGIDVLVLADGGKSTIKTVQKAGRAMRPKKGRPNECRIYDFRHHTHSKLLEHSEARVKVYKREDFEVVDAPA